MSHNMMATDTGIRPYKPAIDLPHLAQLLTEIEAIDQDGEDTSEAMLRDQLQWPNHQPEEDCWVVEAPGLPRRLIGYGSAYAQTAERCTGYVAVHPRWRRQGLGSALLARVIGRACQTGAKHVLAYASAKNEASNRFLRRQGMQPVGHAWVMRAPVTLSLAQPEWPSGYRVRSYAEAPDPAALAMALNGFQDMWGHGENSQPMTAERIPNTYLLRHYDPAGIFIAYAPDGSATAQCSVRLNGKQERGRTFDILDAPGVVPAQRHLGLQRPMTLTALQWQHNHSGNDVELQSWGDSEATAAVYQGIGFSLHAHFIAYLLEVMS
jgi:mycothiol synthase